MNKITFIKSKINLDRRTPTALGDMGTTSDADLHFIHSSPSNSDNSLYRVAKQVQSIWYQIYHEGEIMKLSINFVYLFIHTVIRPFFISPRYFLQFLFW